MLTANLLKESKVAVMMEYAEYHSSFIEKAPTMNMKKDERIVGWVVRHLQLPESHLQICRIPVYQTNKTKNTVTGKNAD